jgi:hypothetical protein
MILNEKQYAITITHLKEFQEAFAEVYAYDTSTANLNEQMRRQLHLDSINSQIETLKQEIQEYQKLKSDSLA